MRLPILIVLHQENSTPGRVGNALRERGYALDIRTAALRRSAARHDGGPRRRDLLRRADERERHRGFRAPRDRLDRGAADGSRSRSSASASARRCWRSTSARASIPHADGHAEIGYYPIRPTDVGLSLCDPWPEQVYQWHREGFDLPHGADLLAEGDSFPVQAFRYGSGYALQFHPDVTHATICRWTTRGHERTLSAERETARRAFRRPRGLRSGRPRLARGVPQSLAGIERRLKRTTGAIVIDRTCCWCWHSPLLSKLSSARGRADLVGFRLEQIVQAVFGELDAGREPDVPAFFMCWMMPRIATVVRPGRPMM